MMKKGMKCEPHCKLVTVGLADYMSTFLYEQIYYCGVVVRFEF